MSEDTELRKRHIGEGDSVLPEELKADDFTKTQESNTAESSDHVSTIQQDQRKWYIETLPLDTIYRFFIVFHLPL